MIDLSMEILALLREGGADNTALFERSKLANERLDVARVTRHLAQAGLIRRDADNLTWRLVDATRPILVEDLPEMEVRPPVNEGLPEEAPALGASGSAPPTEGGAPAVPPASGAGTLSLSALLGLSEAPAAPAGESARRVSNLSARKEKKGKPAQPQAELDSKRARDLFKIALDCIPELTASEAPIPTRRQSMTLKRLIGLVVTGIVRKHGTATLEDLMLALGAPTGSRRAKQIKVMVNWLTHGDTPPSLGKAEDGTLVVSAAYAQALLSEKRSARRVRDSLAQRKTKPPSGEKVKMDKIRLKTAKPSATRSPAECLTPASEPAAASDAKEPLPEAPAEAVAPTLTDLIDSRLALTPEGGIILLCGDGVVERLTSEETDKLMLFASRLRMGLTAVNEDQNVSSDVFEHLYTSSGRYILVRKQDRKTYSVLARELHQALQLVTLRI